MKIARNKIGRIREWRKNLLKNKASDDLSELLSHPFELPLNQIVKQITTH